MPIHWVGAVISGRVEMVSVIQTAVVDFIFQFCYLHQIRHVIREPAKRSKMKSTSIYTSQTIGINLIWELTQEIQTLLKGGNVNDVSKTFGWYLTNCFFCLSNFTSINELFVFVVTFEKGTYSKLSFFQIYISNQIELINNAGIKEVFKMSAMTSDFTRFNTTLNSRNVAIVKQFLQH